MSNKTVTIKVKKGGSVVIGSPADKPKAEKPKAESK
jgi:hypothetical protein